MAESVRVRSSAEEASARPVFDRRVSAPRPAVAIGPREPRRPLLRMSGYVPGSPAFHRLWNLGLVVPLIVFCLPLLLLIVLALAATQGPRNVFYRGERLGKDMARFKIYKFKTLRDEAATLTLDRVLPSGSQMETPIGKHLRDTRLDELPQLLNVLLGDMNMLGPRPVRPSIAAACQARIPDYDLRFGVRPGLIGYTQALMPHGTDKVIRARVNAALCRRRVAYLQALLFIALTGFSVLGWALRVPARLLLGHLRRDGWASAARPRRGEAVLCTPDRGRLRLRLRRIDDERLLVESDRPLPPGPREYEMTLSARRGKAARCRAVPLAGEQAGGDGNPVWRYTMTYSPNSPLNRYLIDRYLLGRAVIA